MKSILVIDDRDDLRSMIVETLCAAGFTVREAKDGREGLLRVLAEPPELILCDINMPGVNGYLTLQAIRKCRGTNDIPFILMTGSVMENSFRRAKECGADDYMPRPFTPAELLVAVESRLARQDQLDREAVAMANAAGGQEPLFAHASPGRRLAR